MGFRGPPGVDLILRGRASAGPVPLEYTVGTLTCWVCCGAWLILGVSRMLLTLAYMIAGFVLDVAAVLVRREVSKDIELVPLQNSPRVL